MAKNKNPKRLVSLFSGIGGFELAFQSIGVSTTLMCEIDPTAQHILRSNFPGIKLVSDVCDLKKLPRWTDIVCSGFPCQDISTIGPKDGLSGNRSSLIKEVFRLLNNASVEWVIIENVTNMLHLHKGETIKTIVEGLENLGYKWAYRTINSLAFVPQHRCRVFVVASLHHNPKDVLLSDSVSSNLGVVRQEELLEPCGFYWTEGKYAIGLYQNGIPTLKCGSTIGIASPPAILFPNGEIGCPDIRDAERFQGFPQDWTKSAEQITKPSLRWRLIGNAVTVPTVKWIANKIIRPTKYDDTNDRQLSPNDKWPSSAWGEAGHRWCSSANTFPIQRDEISLIEFLQFPNKPLSLKAASGFASRLNQGNVRVPEFFKNAINQYISQKSN